ncbi:MAG: hypothetical protein LUE98_12225 [Tannerellaceae bacterium]|nr:hypothetical protein [Tannerellaceae bacterium]
MRTLLTTLAISAIVSVAGAQKPAVRLTVDASRQIATASPLFNGTNIEDINNQTNGGGYLVSCCMEKPLRRISKPIF